MPNLDKSGPQGFGPMTGRGMGVCGKGMGRFFWGRGRKRGLGRYFGWEQPLSPEEQKQDLAEYRKALQEELQDVDKELSEDK